jgi:hypothetical protein
MRGADPPNTAVAHRIADDVRFLDVEVVEQPYDVVDHLNAVARGVVRLVALAVAAAVERDDAEVLRERIDDARRAPVRVEARRESMHKDDRLAAADLHVVDLDAGRVEEPIFARSLRRCDRSDNRKHGDRKKGSSEHARIVAV